jgi:hypothetical protein
MQTILKEIILTNIINNAHSNYYFRYDLDQCVDKLGSVSIDMISLIKNITFESIELYPELMYNVKYIKQNDFKNCSDD